MPQRSRDSDVDPRAAGALPTRQTLPIRCRWIVDSLSTAEDPPRSPMQRNLDERLEFETLLLLLTVGEVATLLRTTEKAIYEMTRRGQLPGVRVVRPTTAVSQPDAATLAEPQVRAIGGISMSVTIRPYTKRGKRGWEVDIDLLLPSGERLRERRKAPVTSKTAAQRWGEERERHLLVKGLPKEKKEVPTLRAFARTVPRRPRPGEPSEAEWDRRKGVHHSHSPAPAAWGPATGSDHHGSGAANQGASWPSVLPKTVNNTLTTLNMLLKKAVEWNVLESLPCTIKLLPVRKGTAPFYDFAEYEKLVVAARELEWRYRSFVVPVGRRRWIKTR